MKGLNYRPPADNQGNFLPWVHDLRNQSGAYVIRQGRTVVYVGESHSGNLAKTLKRHFWPWRDTEGPHATYNRCKVTVGVRLTPPGAAIGAQNNLIERLKPRDNGTNPNANADPEW